MLSLDKIGVLQRNFRQNRFLQLIEPSDLETLKMISVVQSIIKMINKTLLPRSIVGHLL